jgi:hypothetical protein
MLKHLCLTSLWVLPLLIPIQAAKAEGGCPKGFYPVGGGYCRNIVCDIRLTTLPDLDAQKTLESYKQDCSGARAKWGNMLVPKR